PGGSLRPEEAGDAARPGERHSIETEDLAVPLREVLRDDNSCSAYSGGPFPPGEETACSRSCRLLGACRGACLRDHHYAITSTPRTRFSRTRPDATTSATTMRSDTGQGVE